MPLTKKEREYLFEIYLKQIWVLDDLPYTPEFEDGIVPKFNHRFGYNLSNWSLWNSLIKLRKKKQLPKWPHLGYVGPGVPLLIEGEEERIIKFYDTQSMSVDRLPYTIELSHMARVLGCGLRPLWLQLVDLRKHGRLPLKVDD